MYGRIISLTLGVMMALTGAWTLVDEQTQDPAAESAFSSAGTTTLYSNLTYETSMAAGDDVRDIELHGDLAYASGHSGFYIFNISDPLNPAEVGYIFCPGRDVSVSGDVAALVGEGNPGDCGENNGVHLIDISNPSNPVYTQTFEHVDHTITAYGETGIFHSSSQNLQKYCCPTLSLNDPGTVPPADVTDNPGYQDIIVAPNAYNATIQRWWFPQFAANGDVIQSAACHDVKFDLDNRRGYCAGIDETQIWDTTNPLEPTVLSVIKNPAISIHHSAVGNDAGDLLIINDEMAGVIAAACAPENGGNAPNGALWFYDISDVSNPQLLSYVSLHAEQEDYGHLRCTSHFGEILPNQQQAIWPWYIGGPVLVDFTDLANPTVLDSYVVDGSDAWSAYEHNGYIYTGDTNRGFEVFSIS